MFISVHYLIYLKYIIARIFLQRKDIIGSNETETYYNFQYFSNMFIRFESIDAHEIWDMKKSNDETTSTFNIEVTVISQ